MPEVVPDVEVVEEVVEQKEAVVEEIIEQEIIVEHDEKINVLSDTIDKLNVTEPAPAPLVREVPLEPIREKSGLNYNSNLSNATPRIVELIEEEAPIVNTTVKQKINVETKPVPEQSIPIKQVDSTNASNEVPKIVELIKETATIVTAPVEQKTNVETKISETKTVPEQSIPIKQIDFTNSFIDSLD